MPTHRTILPATQTVLLRTTKVRPCWAIVVPVRAWSRDLAVRIVTLALDLEGLERRAAGRDDRADILCPTRSRPENVLPTPCFDGADHRSRDHPGIGDQTNRSHPEMLLQAPRD